MKGYAIVALRKAAHISMFMLLLALLPGCAVVGPLLSVGGMAGLAPLQYASTAYTVGEFSYEYAVNDQDPGEVIEKKVDAVLTGKAFLLPDFTPGVQQADTADAPVMTASAETPQTLPALSAEARHKRIEQLLGRRAVQAERLELRRLAFLEARRKDTLSLRLADAPRSPGLNAGYAGKATLR
ncbi:hypothetical protein GM415_04735 [Pseudodesulfovibrio cashew]|uniref:Uncharacterized protein n=1 Tax=Pseudodesulfovibrio cashew TaxID=2678688 RepID=A0A6I6JPA6_9BACT|nr:hypothetical protein [Pseudodesulfovibrio cashew]QGY39454.1 hypothetical protein GM415_04735 [Pseudodesulfovibrio cashew]